MVRTVRARHAIAGLTGALMFLAGVGASAQSDVDAAASAERDGRDRNRLSDVWINDVGVLLDVDQDRDRFFSRFSLNVDADASSRQDNFGFVTQGEAFVFVRLSLTDSTGVEQLVFDSQSFDVFGFSNADRQRIELDLLSDFPTDRYAIVLELRSGFDEDILFDVVDASIFRTLDDLPLEDAVLDGRVVNDDGQAGSFAAVQASGAMGPWVLALATLVLGARLRRRPRRQ